MARKKPKPKPAATALTDGQVKKLANTLEGTRWNVYTLAKSMFKADVGEEIFERLQAVANLRKCEECNLWKYGSEFYDKVSIICNGCLDAIDDDEDDE